MYAVNDGYFLKVLDRGKNVVWDIEQHDMACCQEMMEKISSDMERLRNSEGSFVSHEFPMYQGQTLVGYAEIMYYTPYYANENAFSFLCSLNLILVEDMERLHRIDADQLILHRTLFPVRSLLENAAAMFERELADKAVALQIDCGDISVTADRDRLAQVVTNLLSNAVKYTESGGEISVSAGLEKGTFRLTVRDTGIGISPEDLPHIFERFYRSDKSRSRSTGG